MTVYVDDMYRLPMGRFRRMKMSHMMADTDDELHAMADRIRVARKWFQGDHYDIAITKRVLAVAAGAVEITTREMAAYSWLKRSRGLVVSPAEAIVRLREFARAEVRAQ